MLPINSKPKKKQHFELDSSVETHLHAQTHTNEDINDNSLLDLAYWGKTSEDLTGAVIQYLLACWAQNLPSVHFVIELFWCINLHVHLKTFKFLVCTQGTCC